MAMGTDASTRRARVALAVGGGGLLWASGAVHLDLYVTGYRRIPTVGSLFLLQTAVAVLLGAAVVVTARRAPRRHPTAAPFSIEGHLAALGGVLFSFGTVVAYALSRAVGLLGFHERPTTAGLVAGIFETGAFAACGALVIVSRVEPSRSGAAPAPRGAPLTGAAVRPTSRRRPRAVGPRPLVTMTTMTGVVTAGLLAAAVAFGHGSPAAPVGANSGSTAPPATAVRMVHVRISGYAFQPDQVRARPGEVIAVTNDDRVTHTMTAVPGSVPFGRFDTGYVDPGRTVRIRAPKAPGSYAFDCSIHNFMKGVLVVSG